jgi:hypothetical protein
MIIESRVGDVHDATPPPGRVVVRGEAGSPRVSEVKWPRIMLSRRICLPQTRQGTLDSVGGVREAGGRGGRAGRLGAGWAGGGLPREGQKRDPGRNPGIEGFEGLRTLGKAPYPGAPKGPPPPEGFPRQDGQLNHWIPHTR